MGDPISARAIYTPNLATLAATLAHLSDLGVGFTILPASLSSTAKVQVISGMLTTIIDPTLEAAAKQEVEQLYAGTYIATISDLTIIVDTNTGLSITQWADNDTGVVPFDTLLGASAA